MDFIDLTITASRLVFKPTADGRYTVNVALGVYCRNAKNQLIGMVAGRLRATVTEATYREYMVSGIAYPIRLPVQGLPDVLKIIVSDYGSGLPGTAVTRVRSK